MRRWTRCQQRALEALWQPLPRSLRTSTSLLTGACNSDLLSQTLYICSIPCSVFTRWMGSHHELACFIILSQNLSRWSFNSRLNGTVWHEHSLFSLQCHRIETRLASNARILATLQMTSRALWLSAAVPIQKLLNCASSFSRKLSFQHTQKSASTHSKIGIILQEIFEVLNKKNVFM